MDEWKHFSHNEGKPFITYPQTRKEIGCHFIGIRGQLQTYPY